MPWVYNTTEPETDDAHRELFELKKTQLLASIQERELQARIEGRLLIHPNQELTATKVVQTIFDEPNIVFQLVKGLTQSGKTGCMIAVVKLCVARTGCNLSINPGNIFIVTCLSSKEWLGQTRDRFPTALGLNIFHRGSLKELGTRLKGCRDVLIIIDEVHIASKKGMTIDKMMEETGFKDMDVLRKRNISFVEFSATPNGVMEDVTKWKDYAKQHMMQPGPGYKGVIEQLEAGRVFQAEDLYIDDDPTTQMTSEQRELQRQKIAPAKEAIERFRLNVLAYSSPRYHIVRLPTGAKFEIVKGRFHGVFSSDDVDHLACHSKANDSEVQKTIVEVPSRHTIVYIKEHLRCAVTLEPKTNIGILYERIPKTVNDDVMTQGLAGRGTGYDVPDDLLIYTNIESLQRYATVWNSGFTDLGDFTYQGQRTRKPKTTFMSPKCYSNTGLAAEKKEEPEWDLCQEEFDTLVEVNKMLVDKGCRRKTSKSLKMNDNGFILSSTTKTKSVLEYSAVKAEIANWANTTAFDLKKKEKRSHSRVIITYRDLTNKDSVVYIVRIAIKRITS